MLILATPAVHVSAYYLVPPIFLQYSHPSQQNTIFQYFNFRGPWLTLGLSGIDSTIYPHLHFASYATVDTPFNPTQYVVQG